MKLFYRHSPLKGLFFATAVILAAAAVIALFNIDFETDIVSSLPGGNAVMDEGTYVLQHHPYQNRVFIDIAIDRKNPDKLVEAAQFFQAGLRESGLFKTVGAKEIERLFPELIGNVADNLPFLFTDRELKNKVAPLLEKADLEKRLKQNLSRLYTMDSAGQSAMIIKDPLGLSGLVLEKLRQLVPASNVRFYKGQILSPDGRHLLITANPKETGTGAKLAHQIDNAVNRTCRELEQKYSGSELNFTTTPVGAYRAVIDNEVRAKQDTKNALFWATLGIACLLLLAFPRPHIGLLAFVPAVFGTVCSLAFYSIWHDSISVMTIGFGVAIISITVDHGISYLLFLDRPHKTGGKQVSKEVRAVAFLAALTSVGAFFMLSFSGFPILGEIGMFAAFGIAFSFMFVHSGFPLLFPELKPAKRGGNLVLQSLVDRITVPGGKYKASFCLVLFLSMAFFANPDFNVDISSMNTVSRKTIAAESLVSRIWGQRLFDKIYLMAQAPDPDILQQRSDILSARLESEIKNNTLSRAFLPSDIFPGEQRCRNNLEAWRQFWKKHDRQEIRKQINKAAAALGMPKDAFRQVYRAPAADCNGGLAINQKFYNMLGIHHLPETGSWMLFASLTPAENYNPESFFRKYSYPDWLKVFDPNYYSRTISEFLSHTFARMLVFIGVSVTVLLLLFFMDPALTAVALMPICFSMVCTLGVLGLVNLPLNLPGLMLSVVVVGMGLDYSLYFVRGYQRYRVETHPFQAHIRMTVFLAGTSTLIGFGTLALGDHNLMKSLGQVLVAGIAFVMLGTFAFLPPFLKYMFRPARFSTSPANPGSSEHKKRIRRLYRHLEAYPRMFARFKLRVDPMFGELPELIGKPGSVVDIGCGYGVTAAWLIAMDPRVRLCCIDPDPERTRITERITGSNGEVFQAAAPALPDFKPDRDLALMIDMVHYLSDAELDKTLAHIRAGLAPGGRVLIRATIPLPDRRPVLRKIEEMRLRLTRTPAYYRDTDRIKNILTACGFLIQDIRPSGAGREEMWFLAEKTASDTQ